MIALHKVDIAKFRNYNPYHVKDHVKQICSKMLIAVKQSKCNLNKLV